MAGNLPPMLNLLATDAGGTTYDRMSIEYMRFVIGESSATDQQTLIDCLVALPYPKFLKTVYWQIIRAHVIGKAPKCQRCRVKDAFHVHHRSYRIHGAEHHNTDLLVGLCGFRARY